MKPNNEDGPETGWTVLASQTKPRDLRTSGTTWHSKSLPASRWKELARGKSLVVSTLKVTQHVVLKKVNVLDVLHARWFQQVPSTSKIQINWTYFVDLFCKFPSSQTCEALEDGEAGLAWWRFRRGPSGGLAQRLLWIHWSDKLRETHRNKLNSMLPLAAVSVEIWKVDLLEKFTWSD